MIQQTSANSTACKKTECRCKEGRPRAKFQQENATTAHIETKPLEIAIEIERGIHVLIVLSRNNLNRNILWNTGNK